MLPKLRRINRALLILVVLQAVTLLGTEPANAVSAFLYEPFYGNWRESTKKYDAYPVNRNASFDHRYPDYGARANDSMFSFRDGSTRVPSSACVEPYDEKKCYNGHSGIDYGLDYAPAVAAASGTVQYAGWNNPNHETALGLMVRIDHGNNYRTIYGHLSAAVAYTGQVIGGYDPYKKSHVQIGTSGTTGNSTGPHLHFEVRTLYNGTWKAVDPFGWSGATPDPWEVDVINGVKYGGVKSVNLWVAAPRQYPPPGDGPVVMDDGSAGFSTGGSWNIVSNSGYGNDLRWRYTSTSQNAWARWNPYVPITTQYEIQAHIPAWPAGEQQNRTDAASYHIYSNGQRVRTVTVDQHRVGYRNGTYSDQWVSLGRYFFNQGSTSYIQLTDAAYFVCNNSEKSGCTLYFESGKRIIVDALRFYAN